MFHGESGASRIPATLATLPSTPPRRTYVGLADRCNMEGSHVTRRKRNPSSHSAIDVWVLVIVTRGTRKMDTHTLLQPSFAREQRVSWTTCCVQARVGLRSTHTIPGNGVSSQRQSRVQRGERRSTMNGFKPSLAGANC